MPMRSGSRVALDAFAVCTTDTFALDSKLKIPFFFLLGHRGFTSRNPILCYQGREAWIGSCEHDAYAKSSLNTKTVDDGTTVDLVYLTNPLSNCCLVNEKVPRPEAFSIKKCPPIMLQKLGEIYLAKARNVDVLGHQVTKPKGFVVKVG
jgi:hypothetical protein